MPISQIAYNFGVGSALKAVGAGHARDAASPCCERRVKNEAAAKNSGMKLAGKTGPAHRHYGEGCGHGH